MTLSYHFSHEKSLKSHALPLDRGRVSNDEEAVLKRWKFLVVRVGSLVTMLGMVWPSHDPVILFQSWKVIEKSCIASGPRAGLKRWRSGLETMKIPSGQSRQPSDNVRNGVAYSWPCHTISVMKSHWKVIQCLWTGGGFETMKKRSWNDENS